MKTTVEISDALFERARRHARRVGKPMRALFEEGLQRVLDVEEKAVTYELPDLAVGKPNRPNPLESMSWQDIRDEIYGGR